MSKPKRVKGPPTAQFNVRIRKDVFTRANALRVENLSTWPELIEQLLEAWAATLEKPDQGEPEL